VSNLAPDDLDHMFAGLAPLLKRLRGRRLFITGGTGFVGKWLLEALLDADSRLGLGLEIVALSRHPGRFAASAPALARAPQLRLIEGDVRDFALPEGRFDFILHAATDVVPAAPPLELFDTCAQGTRRVLDFALHAGARELLLVSSGAIYGRQPPELAQIPESYRGAPDPTAVGSAYGEGKRVSEWLGAAYAERGLSPKIARCFAFVGPYLPLDAHFAVGNFLRDAMAGEPISIRGDGTAVRSYLHAADLTVWLLTILLNGRVGGAYNVGSDEALSIADLARRVAAVLGSTAELALGIPPAPGRSAERYVPDISLAREELALDVAIGLDDAIRRTARWHGWEAGE
jgi:dTDP-glucose 4,6-dehydratase